MKRALCAIAWIVGTLSAVSFGVFLGGGVPRLNPFAALLGMVAAPFIFWMGLAARQRNCALSVQEGARDSGGGENNDTHGVPGVQRCGFCGLDQSHPCTTNNQAHECHPQPGDCVGVRS